MKNSAHIALITVIQLIACYLADWGSAETVFILCFIVLWQDCLYGCFLKYEKNGMCRMGLILAKAFGIY